MTAALKLLLVEDAPTDAKLVVQEIRRAGHDVEFERVEDPEEMRAALEKQTWDLIICDWSMPRFSALAALEMMKAQGLDLPFIIVSGTIGEEHAVAAMRAGAHDFLLKDKLARLTPVIERELREHEGRAAHRASQRALEASESRFARLAQCGIIGILSAESAGPIHEANDAFLGMVGYSREELLEGKLSWRHLTPPEWQPANERAFRELKEHGFANPHEKEYLRKDGTRIPVLLGIAALTDTTSIAFMVDLTGQKSAEEALRKSGEQLRQAQKMEAVGRLAGGVAHDFNNLLSVVLSYSTMLTEELQAGDPLHTAAAEIEKAGQRAASLTRQLLTFSRQEVVAPRIVDLNDVLANMDKMLQRILGEDVALATLGGPQLGRVRADPTHIEQVIMNLIVNSRDAMPTGGKLTIETQNVELSEEHASSHLGVKPGRYVMLAVSDTGMGMDAATQARIFEPFFTTKEIGKGTGLGLSTVFGIVQQCRGSIWVYSELNQGTTFKVYLPRVDATAEVIVAAAAPATLDGTETILLVEDEDQIRQVAKEILRKRGYRVIEARNAGEALLHCESFAGTIDLLLTDVVMPQMSGPELAKRLARERVGIKIICMSGYTDEALVRHGALAAGIAYLAKPITPDTLLRKVREVLDRP